MAAVCLVLAAILAAWSNGRDLTGTVGAARIPGDTLNAGAADLIPIGNRVGERAPDFTLLDSNGRRVSLSAFRGQPVIINFWASWCTYCRVEMPELDSLYKDESQRQGLVVLAVDTFDLDRLSAEAFIVGKAIAFTVLWDEDNRVANLYGVRSLPGSFFLDREGIIRGSSPGAMSRDEMRGKAETIFPVR